MQRTWAIIPAAGSGVRLGANVPKAFVRIGKATLLQQSVRELFTQGVRNFIIALPAEISASKVELNGLDANVQFVEGGKERQDSVRNAARLIPEDCDFVLIHDAARPFLRAGVVNELLEAAYLAGAAMPVLPVADTLKTVRDGFIVSTVPREGLARIQTPQVFRGDLFRELLPLYEYMVVTDDSALAEKWGYSPAVVPGSAYSFKITTPEDLEIARLIMTTRSII